MKKTLKSLLVVVLLVASAFGLAGCKKGTELEDLKKQLADLQSQYDAKEQELQDVLDTIAQLHNPDEVKFTVKRGSSEVEANSEVKVNAGTTAFSVVIGPETAGLFYKAPVWTFTGDSQIAFDGEAGALDILPDDLEVKALQGTVNVKVESYLKDVAPFQFNFTVKADQFIMPELTGTTVTVGNAQMNGEFLFAFGNSAYDNAVRQLIYGYETISNDQGGQFLYNDTALVLDENGKTLTEVLPERDETVMVPKLDDNGVPVLDPKTDEPVMVPTIKKVQDKKYTFTVEQGLVWNDGLPVTAKDYVFTVLWNASKQWLDAGASATDGEFLVGYDDYHDGNTSNFAGVRLVDDYTFTLTVNGANLPYFYELAMVAITPIPMHVFAPTASIIDEAAGARLSANAYGKMDELISADGYRYNPTVTCGPYKFVSFRNQVAIVTLNPLFAGNFEGQKPTIQNVVVKWINQTTDVDQVIAGSVDFVNGVIEGAKIEKAKAASNVALNDYKRNGYGLIAFACDFGPTQYAEVRRGLAYLLNRQEFIQTVLGGYGAVVDGEYGLSQWMYVEKQQEIADQLNHYTLNIAQANAELDLSPYKFEADGTTPFDATKAVAGSGYFRYNAQKEVLQINHFGTTDNTVTDTVETQWKANTEKAGVKFTIEKGGFDKLLNDYYYSYKLPDASRKYHSFNLASNFTAQYDPYYSWHSDWLGTWYNANQLSDEELDDIMMEMRQLSGDQQAEFANLWLQYQVRWNELMPNIPLYSNQYHDVFSSRISNVHTASLWEWGYDIVYWTVAE